MPIPDPARRFDPSKRKQKTLSHHAPIFTRGFDFYCWLLDRISETERSQCLGKPLIQQSRRLIEAVTLALQGFSTYENLRVADEATALLRLHLRVGENKGLLDERQYHFALDTLNDMGRQLGGWLKKWEGEY